MGEDRVGEGGSASAKSRPRAPLTSPGATAQPRRCFCCRWNSSSQGWRNPGAEQPVPRRGCRGRGTAHLPGHCETQTPMHRDGLGTVGKVQLPAVALLWELRSHSGPGEEAWGHGTLPVGPPYTSRHGCCKHRGLQGTPSPSEPFKGAKEPTGSTGGDLAAVTANPLQSVPRSWFYLTGHLQHPSSHLQPQSPIKTPPMPAKHVGIPFSLSCWDIRPRLCFSSQNQG